MRVIFDSLALSLAVEPRPGRRRSMPGDWPKAHWLPDWGPIWLAALLGLAFGVAAALSHSIWCTAGHALARLLRTDRQWQVLNAVLGVLLVAPIILDVAPADPPWAAAGQR